MLLMPKFVKFNLSAFSTVNNVYFVSPEKESSELGGKQLAAASPPVSEGRFLSNMEVSSSICTPRVSEESSPFFCQIEEGGVLNNPLYNIKGPVSPSHHPQPPPLPTGLRAKKPPLPTAANLSKSAELKSPRTDDVSSGSSAEEEKGLHLLSLSGPANLSSDSLSVWRKEKTGGTNLCLCWASKKKLLSP